MFIKCPCNAVIQYSMQSFDFQTKLKIWTICCTTFYCQNANSRIGGIMIIYDIKAVSMHKKYEWPKCLCFLTPDFHCATKCRCLEQDSATFDRLQNARVVKAKGNRRLGDRLLGHCLQKIKQKENYRNLCHLFEEKKTWAIVQFRIDGFWGASHKQWLFGEFSNWVLEQLSNPVLNACM